MKTNKYIVILVSLIGVELYAAQSYRVNIDDTVLINEHGVSKNVKNNSCPNDLFVPTKTTTEWSNFRTNIPACVTAVNPPTGCAATTIHSHSIPAGSDGASHSATVYDCGPGRESWIICSNGSHEFSCSGTTWIDFGENYAICKESNMMFCEYY